MALHLLDCFCAGTNSSACGSGCLQTADACVCTYSQLQHIEPLFSPAYSHLQRALIGKFLSRWLLKQEAQKICRSWPEVRWELLCLWGQSLNNGFMDFLRIRFICFCLKGNSAYRNHCVQNHVLCAAAYDLLDELPSCVISVEQPLKTVQTLPAGSCILIGGLALMLLIAAHEAASYSFRGRIAFQDTPHRSVP